MLSVRKGLLTLILFLDFFCSVFSQNANCPNGKPWLKRGTVCARVNNEQETWRVADTNCRMTKGRTVQVLNNETSMDEWLERNRNRNHMSSMYWIGAHVPALTLASYYDRCLNGFQRNGVCYQVVTSPMTWEVAKSYCSDSGGYIVHVNDEQTSRFVAEIFHRRLKHKTSSPPPPGYWIDGRSDEDLSVEFVDRDGIRLNYTNLQPSIVIDSQSLAGSACLEVLYDPPSLSTETPSTSTTDYYDDYSEVQHDSAPLYNIQNCQVSRMFVCEFSLVEKGSDGSFFEQARAMHSQREEGGGGAVATPADNSHIYSPSHVRSCEEIVILSDLANEMRSNMEELEESLRVEIPLLEMFTDVINAFYIMLRADRSFELEYCDMDATRDKLKLHTTTPRHQRVTMYLQMFRWSVFDYIEDSDVDLVYDNENDEESSKRLVDFNLFDIRSDFTFIGPCVFMDTAGDGSGVWHTSPCQRPLPYICEYPPSAAEGLGGEEKDEPTPMAEIEQKIDDFDSEFGGIEASMGRQAVDSALDVLGNIVEAGISENGNMSLLSQATFDELDTLLQQTLPIVDSLQSFDVADSDTMNSVNQYLGVRAVSALAENLADKLIEGQNKFESTSEITQLNYKTNTSEVRIVLSESNVNPESLMNALTFQPDQVGTTTRITIKPNLDAITRMGKAAFVFAVHSASSSFYQQQAAAKRVPSFMTSNNGQTHIKLVRLDQKAWRVGTPIITATLRMNGSSVPTPVQFNLPKFHFPDVLPVNRSEVCSYLVYTNQETLWSDSGCHESRAEDEGVYQCSCNHTTDFAVLLLVYTPTTEELFDHTKSIFILTLVGESLSVISLIATALTYYVLRNLLKSDRITVHLNLVVGLFITHVTLLVGQILRATSHQVDALDGVACSFLAFLLHFSLLSSFAWMLVEGFILYKKILIVLTRETPVFERKYYLIGWIFPLLIVLLSFVICIGANIPYNDIRCWLSLENGVIWSFAAPATIIFMVNMVILVRVLCVAVATRRRRFIRNLNTNSHVTFHRLWHRDLKVAARGVIFLAPLLGVTWIFGFLVVTSVVCAYAFIFCNAFQGFYLFLFYVVLNPEVRGAWQEKQRLRERKFLNNADLPKLPPLERKSWFRRFSTSLMTRLSPSSTSSSGSTSPSSAKPENRRESNGVNDFVASQLRSRPSSGKSISKHLTSLGVSMTSLRPKSGRVCPESSVAMTTTGDADADWVSVSESEASNSNMDDVFCGVGFGVEDGNNKCECLHHLSSGSCGSNISHGGAKGEEKENDETSTKMFEGKNESPPSSVAAKGQDGEINLSEKCKNEDIVATGGGRAQQQHGRNTKCDQNALVCQSRLCTICNKNPKNLKATGRKSHKPAKLKTRAGTSKRPATAGNNTKPARRRDTKAKQGKRNNAKTRLVLKAWSTKSASLEVLSTANSQYAADDLIGHLEYHASKVPANGRPQSSESHDSGIVMTP